MNSNTSLEVIADSVKVFSTGAVEVTVQLANISVDEVLSQFDVEDVIQYYGASELLATIDRLLHEED